LYIRKAFTMIELVFVIVVIGILSAIAIPKFAATRDDAVLVKGKSQVSAIRSGIAMQKSKALLQGDNTDPYGSNFRLLRLDDANASVLPHDGKKLFYFGDGNTSNVLEYPILSKQNHDGSWTKTNTNKYSFRTENQDIAFEYNPTTGIFDCNKTTGAPNIDKCKELTN